jgi:transcriptional regulator with XRE-family HTH domain
MTPQKRWPHPHPRAHELIKVLDVHLQLSGMSRRQLSKASGVGEATLTTWWQGKCCPHVYQLEQVLKVFDLRLKIATLEKPAHKGVKKPLP